MTVLELSSSMAADVRKIGKNCAEASGETALPGGFEDSRYSVGVNRALKWTANRPFLPDSIAHSASSEYVVKCETLPMILRAA